MDTTKLFEAALGVIPPWCVAGIDFKADEKSGRGCLDVLGSEELVLGASRLAITEIGNADGANGVVLAKLSTTDMAIVAVGCYRFDVPLTKSGTAPTTKKNIARSDVADYEAASL